MRDPSTIAALNSELEHNPRMQVQAVQERKYYEDKSGVVSGQLLGLAVFVAIVMGIGVVFGAMNTMYALVAARTREIGTLRALGFSTVSILTGFVVESTFLAIVGGALGCLIALPANGINLGGRGRELRGDRVRLPDQRGIARGGNGARGSDGCRGRRVARVPRGTDADHVGA
jgi:hypothetical protein